MRPWLVPIGRPRGPLSDRAGQPRFSTLIARTPTGQRFLCRVPPSDGATLAALTSGEFEPVGRRGVASEGADGYVDWRFSASQEHLKSIE